MVRLTTALLAGAIFAGPVLAQDINGIFVDHWKTSKKYMLALAEQMPAGDYGFKPNPAEMSFGQQMAHIAGANSFFFATISGQKDPIAKPTQFDKASVLKMLNTSYDFAIATLENLKPEQLHATYDSPDGKMTGVELLLLATDHTAHHRGQCIVYLRAKGIKPANYEF
ncbi:MAG TPA: DinB family protein [Bryobacteraceae bacterium]|nr:DinB family protein [Bryobacteraceae bacterium]